MTSIGPELLAELVPTILYAIAAGALTILGVLAELNSFQYLGSGDLVLAIWFAGIGTVMLYAGVYGIAYQKLLARVVSR